MTRDGALQRYLGGGIGEVEGWLDSGALSALLASDAFQKERGIAGDVVEIGVHHGKLFILLSLLRRSGEKAIAIDVFGDQHLNPDRSGRGDRDVFIANLSRFDADRDVEVWQRDSLTLTAKDFSAGVRLFSVDGSHTAIHTRHDLAVAAGALAPGGIVIVDDFYNSDWPGVQEGVHEFLREKPAVVPFFYANNKLLLAGLDWHQAWLDGIAARLKPLALRSKLVTMHGHDVLSCRLPRPAIMEK